MFFITTIENIDDEMFDLSRTVGYVESLEEAKEILEYNCCDLYETIYEYAVIEDIKPGLYQGHKGKKYWFKWNEEKEGYEEIEKPEYPESLKMYEIAAFAF